MSSEIDRCKRGKHQWAARENAHAAYSRFLAGAVITAESGERFTRCNIENISFGSAICTERAALAALSAGSRQFAVIAIVAALETRSLRAERVDAPWLSFDLDPSVYTACSGRVYEIWILAGLLPPSPFARAEPEG